MAVLEGEGFLPCFLCSVSTTAGGAEGLLLSLSYTERLMMLLKEKALFVAFEPVLL